MKKNFSKLKRFNVNLKALGTHKDEFMMETLKELAQMFLAEVKKRTPVGEGAFIVVGIRKRGKKKGKGKPKLKRISQGGVLRSAWRIKRLQNIKATILLL